MTVTIPLYQPKHMNHSNLECAECDNERQNIFVNTELYSLLCRMLHSSTEVIMVCLAVLKTLHFGVGKNLLKRTSYTNLGVDRLRTTTNQESAFTKSILPTLQCYSSRYRTRASGIMRDHHHSRDIHVQVLHSDKS